MAVNLSPVGGVAAQFFTNSGAPLTGGKIFTYAAGTTTPQASYTTSQGNVAWTNPIVLDAAGRVPSSGEIWLTDGLIYKFVLKDANDVLIATYDNITGINSNAVAYTNSQEIQTATAGQTVFTLTTMQYQVGTNSLSVFVDGVNQYGPGAQYSYVETDSTTVTFNAGLHVGAEVKFTTTQQQGAGAVDAEQVSYQPPFTGSVATNVEAKLAQYVSVKDFGAVGDGITDDTTAIQTALNQSSSLYFPPGTYVVSSVQLASGTSLIGAGYAATVLKLKDNATPNTELLTTNYQNNVQISGIYFDGNGANQTYSSDDGQNAILVRNSQNVSISNCRFNNWGKDAVLLYSDDVAADPVKNITITNNVFENPRRAGVTIISGEQIVVANNQFYGINAYTPVTNAGVTWEPDANTDTLADLIVDGNTFTNMLAGCRLTDASNVKPSINNVLVSNNTFMSISGEAAVVAYRLYNAGVSVVNNKFKSCGNSSASANIYRQAGGVFFSETNDAIICENKFDQCTSTAYATVYSDGENDRCQIKNNVFINDGKSGIQINRNSAVTRGDGTFKQITGNIMLNGGQDAANTYTAIILTSTGGAGGGILDVVSGNSIKTSTTVSYGTAITVNQDNGTSQVFGNQISGNGIYYSFDVTPGQCQYTAPSTACYGALTTSIVWKATRIENVVTLEIPNVIGTTTNVADINLGALLPAPFRPSAAQVFSSAQVLINNTPATLSGLIQVADTGLITLYRDNSYTTWGTAANTGVIATSVSWLV